MPVKQIENNELVLNYVKSVDKSIREGKVIPLPPKGVKVEDLPPTVQALVLLKRGKITFGEFTEIIDTE